MNQQAEAPELIEQSDCTHFKVAAYVGVNMLEDCGRFSADVRIQCVNCGTLFQFIGLPVGVDLNGATVSVDGTEGRFAIVPKPLPEQ